MEWSGENGIIAAALTTIIGVGITFKKLGWMSFGKKECPDKICHGLVVSTAEHLKEMRHEFLEFKKDVYPKINTTAETVAGLDGFIRGKLG